MEPLLSLCMIVKDEKDELPLALASVAGVVDELVVYDTGSSDPTVEIAEDAGARVVRGYWDDDFARARNAAIDACRGEWVLVLDADESLHGDGEALRGRLRAAPPELEALAIALETLEGGGLAGHISFYALRLFRRSRCHYVGRLHEQVRRRADDTPPGSTWTHEVRILHRGYTASHYLDGSKRERNLRLARLAAADDAVDHPEALFNLGRTLMTGNEPESGVAPLREAASTTANPILRRHALTSLALLEAALGHLEEALVAVDELRQCSVVAAGADILEAQVHLSAGEPLRCLEACERVPFLVLDDNGLELGRHLVASLRARALATLGRPSEAAEVLLDTLGSHGLLDCPLGELVSYLLAAGRPLAEIASAVRPEILAVLAAAAVQLPETQSDVVLTALHERFPDRPEPVALGAALAARLPVARARWWSAALRRHGQTDQCPLLAILGNDRLEHLVRLRAAAAVYVSFADERAVEPARQLIGSLPAAEATAATADVAAISPALAALLASGSTAAVLLSCAGEARDGYRCLDVAESSADGGVEPDRLPLANGSAHLLVTGDALARFPAARAGSILDEWLRVLCPGGELVVEVPDLAAAATRLLEATAARDEPAAAAALREIYGANRTAGCAAGGAGKHDGYSSGWTRPQLERLLARHGFDVDSVDEGGALRVRSRAAALVTRLAAGPAPEISLLVVAERDEATLRRCLRSVAGSDAGASYEVVCFDNSAADGTARFCESLDGAVTVVKAAKPMTTAAALNVAARFASGEVIVMLSEHVQLSDGWGAGLMTALAETDVAATSAALVDAGGSACGGPLDLRGHPDPSRIERRPSGGPPDALGAGCVALRAGTWADLGGLSSDLELDEAVIDLTLRAGEIGRLVAATVKGRIDATAGDTAASRHSAEELARRWAARLSRPSDQPIPLSTASLLPSSTLLERIASSDLAVGSPRPGGCNLVGDFAGLGGESGRVRGWAAAAAACALPMSRLGYRAGRLDPELAGGEPLAYDTTLLCLAGEDLVEYVARVGLDALRERHTILDWHWPFSSPGPETANEASMVSEIWVPSAFSQRAIRQASARPVRLQLQPVLPARARFSRRDLGMPDDFVFATIAEVGRGRSGEVALANPVGVVEAFCAAFPQRGEASCFVALSGSRTEAVAEACREAASGRSDVVVAEQLPAGGAESVLALADCYVSLHRSSAFGMSLAGALATGVPVVSTAGGGPLEYLDSSVAELVDATPVTTLALHAPYPAGLAWFEPDLDDAAAALLEVLDAPEQTRAKAHAGAVRIGRTHGAELTGRMMRRRVEAVAPLRTTPPHQHRGRRRARR